MEESNTRNPYSTSHQIFSPVRAPVKSPFEAHGISSQLEDVQVSEEFSELSIDEHFLENHLSQVPSDCSWFSPKSDKRHTKAIRGGGTVKTKIYGPLCSLLSCISERVFEYIECAGVSCYHTKAIVFINHHHNPLQHSPGPEFRNQPDLVGVYGPKQQHPLATRDKDPEGHKSVPHHLTQTLVEVSLTIEDGGAQVAGYAWQHLQARPDHPGVYVLTANPQYYQVVWSDPSGNVASARTLWSDLTLLACYLYSLYCPPEGHVLHDMSITVEGTGGNPLAPPEWTITSGHQIYEHCHIKYVGHALGRRTTVFETPKSVEEFAIIKEYYRDDKHLYEEDKLIEGIHSEGLFPGVVRLISSETVTIQRNDANATLQKDSKVSNVSFKKARRFSSTPKPIATSRQAKKDEEPTVIHRTKRCLVMGSRGESLRRAKSVHDLLKAIYDILEVHRNVAMKRGVLHRDMSLHNILMYPEHRALPDECAMKDPPKFIDDVLGIASTNPAQADHARCLMIDFDNAAKLLKSEQSQIDDELTCRIGTPVYIARSVSAGAIWNLQDHALSFSHMPELSEEAAKVYFESHPTRRQYDDNIPGWCHGSPVPTDISTLYYAREWIKFRHRMEHDAESIFWTLVSVILRVQPQDARLEEEPSRILSRAWNALQDHQIATMALTDSRDYFFDLNVPVWEATLLPEMKSLGRLLYDLARQVRSEYALLEDQAVPEDHLHEAMQRLIFEYLLKSEDIDLNPDVLRPVVEKVWVHVPERAPRVSTAKRSRPDQGGRDEPKRRRAGQEKSLKRGRREEARRRRSGQKKHNASGIETTKI